MGAGPVSLKVEMMLAKPELDKEHPYAIGFLIPRGVCPVKSYDGENELRKDFADFYKFALRRGLSKPVAVSKGSDIDTGWDGASCMRLDGLMGEVIAEIEKEGASR